MPPNHRGLAATMLLVVLLAPAGAAQTDTIQNPEVSTPTTLYFHIFDTFNKFVINTQPMDSEFFETGGTSFPTVSGTPLNTPEFGDFDFNTIYGISTAGPVEYDFIENGKPRFHPEPGVAADIQIDAAVTPVVTLYASVRDVFGTTNTAPNAVMDYTVRVTIREGDDPGRETETLDAGALILSGEETFHVVNAHACVPGEDESCVSDANAAFAGQSEPGTSTSFAVPDDQGIVEFQIPLTLHRDVIPKKEAFNVRIDGYQGTATGAIEEDQFAQGHLRYLADPEHLPRLDFNIMNPVFIEFLHPQVAAGTLLIHAGVNTPFGTYDVDTDSIAITVEGPTTVPRTDLKVVVTSNAHVHGLHDQAAEVTYLYNFRDHGAPEGEYTIHFAVQNNGVPDANGIIRPETVQVATATAGFVIEGQEAYGIDTRQNVVPASSMNDEKDTPAPGLVPALALLGAALMLRRRFQ